MIDVLGISHMRVSSKCVVLSISPSSKLMFSVGMSMKTVSRYVIQVKYHYMDTEEATLQATLQGDAHTTPNEICFYDLNNIGYYILMILPRYKIKASMLLLIFRVCTQVKY